MSNETANELIEPKPSRPPLLRRLVGRTPMGRVVWKEQLKALTHFLVISVALAALNSIFAKNDPGWLNLNPSPWVIVPFYLGIRFGFIWGIVSGLILVTARFAIEKSLVDPGAEVSFTGSEQFLIWGVVLMGAIGGFVRGVIRRQEEQKEIALRDSEQSNQILKGQVALLKHNEHELSNALVSQGVEASALTLNLRDVIRQNESTERDEAFLNLLRDRCGIQSAAIYFSALDGNSIRVAQLKSDEAFPESMEKSPMFEHAERTGEIVTQRWFWEPFEPSTSGGIDDYYLAVVAHPISRDFRVLVVSQMDFEKIHWENLWKMEASFRWFESTVQSGDVDALIAPVEWKTTESKLADPEPAPSSVELQQPEEVVEQPLAEVAVEEPPIDIVEPIPEQESLPEVEIEQPIVDIEPIETIAEPMIEEPIAAPVDSMALDAFTAPAVAVAGRPILDPPAFKERLSECRRIETETGTQHRLVIFVPNESESIERCEDFAQTLSGNMSPTDDLAKIPSEGGRIVYGLITASQSTEVAEQYASALLAQMPELELRFFVLHLNDPALSAFEN